jgi:hypothetical protein
LANKQWDEPSQWIGELVHRFTIGGISERADAGRLTGDWIIFGKRDGQNYYLDLATHEEGDDPEQLLQKLRVSGQIDFPFLFEAMD